MTPVRSNGNSWHESVKWPKSRYMYLVQAMVGFQAEDVPDAGFEMGVDRRLTSRPDRSTSQTSWCTALTRTTRQPRAKQDISSWRRGRSTSASTPASMPIPFFFSRHVGR
jgi:hypothetical protein